jgi:hypothetical protein
VWFCVVALSYRSALSCSVKCDCDRMTIIISLWCCLMLMFKIVQSLRRDQHDALMKFYDASKNLRSVTDSVDSPKFLPNSWLRHVRAIWNG